MIIPKSIEKHKENEKPPPGKKCVKCVLHTFYPLFTHFYPRFTHLLEIYTHAYFFYTRFTHVFIFYTRFTHAVLFNQPSLGDYWVLMEIFYSRFTHFLPTQDLRGKIILPTFYFYTRFTHYVLLQRLQALPGKNQVKLYFFYTLCTFTATKSKAS